MLLKQPQKSITEWKTRRLSPKKRLAMSEEVTTTFDGSRPVSATRFQLANANFFNSNWLQSYGQDSIIIRSSRMQIETNLNKMR